MVESLCFYDARYTRHLAYGFILCCGQNRTGLYLTHTAGWHSIYARWRTNGAVGAK